MPRTATADTVDRDALLAPVRPRHHVLLGTHRRDGRVQLSPVSAGVDAARRLVVATCPQRAETVDARRGFPPPEAGQGQSPPELVPGG